MSDPALAPVALDVGDAVGLATDGVRRWLGIPYGAPPVGERRFLPAEPAAPWTGRFDATSFGPAAHQPHSFLVGPEPPVVDEDCLHLNVWSPEGAEGLPVMVWFHGGSFTTGMAALPWYDGERLARRGVVVVTVNYRLGPLGFLHLEALGGERFAGAANAGLLDQSLALGWVQRHIAAFGGDPARVTIFGESAGGMSVSTHLALPGSAGRFAGAIAQSGAAGHVHHPEAGERVARAVLDALGVPTGHPERLLDLPAEAFSDVQSRLSVEGDRALPLPFRPTVDGSTLPVPPLDALAPVPLLTGTTLEEMRLFTLMGRIAGGGEGIDEARLLRRVARTLAGMGRSADPGDVVATYRRRLGAAAGPDDVFVAFATDAVFRIPAIEMAEAHGDATWMYLFTHRSDAFDGALGSAHAIEIPFAFDNLRRRGTRFLVGEATDERQGLADRMADAWVAFARHGDPSTPALGHWPRYDTERRATMRLDTSCEVVEDPQGDERRIWTR